LNVIYVINGQVDVLVLEVSNRAFPYKKKWIKYVFILVVNFKISSFQNFWSIWSFIFRNTWI